MADTPKGYKGPSPPSEVKIDGKDDTDQVATRSTGEVKVSAVLHDPTQGQKVKLRVRYSNKHNFNNPKTRESDWHKSGERAVVVCDGLDRNSLYKVRMWAISHNPNVVSRNFTGGSFWTNRPPKVTLVTPAENQEYAEDDEILFDWKYDDPDIPEEEKEDQRHWRIKYWTITTGVNGTQVTGKPKFLPPKEPHKADGAEGKQSFRRMQATRLTANTNYAWTVMAWDAQGASSIYPLAQSFFIRGTSSPPHQLSPNGGRGTAVIASEPTLFSWKFRDPDGSNTQTQADIRWRVVGSGDPDADPEFDESWFTTYGEGITPGTTTQWEIAPGHFTPGFLYEWQIRTYESKRAGIPSLWSASAEFVAAVAPGSSLVDLPLAEEFEAAGALGCGTHRVFVYDRPRLINGKYVAAMRGEIKPLERVTWTRKRDDIGNCLVDTNGFDQDCCALLGDLRCWVHELVIFRDGVRVFEGPITRITYSATSVEVEAKDVMAYLYRRVMRQGYNDTLRRIDLTPRTAPSRGLTNEKGGPYTIIGLNTVVDRALQIALNALAYQDPNVLPYLTAVRFARPDELSPKSQVYDAEQSRNVPDYSRTAWEEIDDLAATAGLDYVTIGRRIVFWDTHRVIGRLPEMRDGDFSEPVIVTEYGMQLANWYGVTNNSGVAGIAYPVGLDSANWYTGKPVAGTNGFAHDYGPVEMLSSAYGEQQGAAVTTDVLTASQRHRLVAGLTKQAKLGIGNRWPTPVVVRVPDNSALNPEINVGINQLVPGVWIPLRATLTCRKLAMWQKLDQVNVEEAGGVEAVRVTMSPAPHGGDEDPDLSGQVEAE